MLSCIVAVAENNAIGKNNKMPWHIKEDLAYFKKTTLGHKIIMGRKTFESLPSVLPDREHIVVTNNRGFSAANESIKIEYNLFNVLNDYKNIKEEIFVIGGATIYNEALPMCNKLYLTRIHKTFEADTFFPSIDFDEFILTEKSDIKTSSDINFNFEVYTRK